ncbi:MAG: co-chaperone GroES [Candidatus Magasanikbacteria bacterium]
MNIKPLGDRILVKPVKEEEVTKSGIVLPDTVDKEKKMEGEVIAVGPGKLMENGQRAPMDISVGQKVLFKKWGGEEVDIDGVEHKILNQDDVMAVIE